MMSVTPNVVVVCDNGSANIDDDFLILMALDAHRMGEIRLKLIISTHFFADLRAQAIRVLAESFGVTDVPVCADSRPLQFEAMTQLDPVNVRRKFYAENPLWPASIYGLPKYISLPNQIIWCPKFLSAHLNSEHHHPTETAATTAVTQIKNHRSTSDGLEMLCRLLSDVAVGDHLNVVWAAPPEMLTALPKPLWTRMRLMMTGGGFNSGHLGYNWGLNPRATQTMLDLAVVSRGLPIDLVTPNLAKLAQLCVSPDMYRSWALRSTNDHRSLATKRVLQHWSDYLEARQPFCDRNPDQLHMHLAAPTAFVLLLHRLRTSTAHAIVGGQLAHASIDMARATGLDHYLSSGQGRGPLHLDLITQHPHESNAESSFDVANVFVLMSHAPDQLRSELFARIQRVLFKEDFVPPTTIGVKEDLVPPAPTIGVTIGVIPTTTIGVKEDFVPPAPTIGVVTPNDVTQKNTVPQFKGLNVNVLTLERKDSHVMLNVGPGATDSLIVRSAVPDLESCERSPFLISLPLSIHSRILYTDLLLRYDFKIVAIEPAVGIEHWGSTLADTRIVYQKWRAPDRPTPLVLPSDAPAHVHVLVISSSIEEDGILLEWEEDQSASPSPPPPDASLSSSDSTQSKHRWVLPHGRRQPSESVERAAIRIVGLRTGVVVLSVMDGRMSSFGDNALAIAVADTSTRNNLFEMKQVAWIDRAILPTHLPNDCPSGIFPTLISSGVPYSAIVTRALAHCCAQKKS